MESKFDKFKIVLKEMFQIISIRPRLWYLPDHESEA